MSRLAIQNGRVIRLTFSKDKLFRPGNDKVLIEIRVAGDGPDHRWINYDLSGNVVGNENAVKSGIGSFARFRAATRRIVPARPNRNRHRRLHAPDRERAVRGP